MLSPPPQDFAVWTQATKGNNESADVSRTKSLIHMYIVNLELFLELFVAPTFE